MTKTTIQLEVTTCQDCPFLASKRHYTEDSFEMAFDWFCGKSVEQNDGNPRQIAGYVEWNDVDNIKIPEWCPLKVK